jgi:hypothetical protein
MVTRLLKMKKDNFNTLSFVLPVLFFIFCLATTHIKEILILNADKGTSLMAAFLHTKGFALYKEIRGWASRPF